MIKTGVYLEQFCEQVDMPPSQRKALNNRLLASKLPLIIYNESFDPDRWRMKWNKVSFRYYPSFKMKVIMALASLKLDYLLLKVAKIKKL